MFSVVSHRRDAHASNFKTFSITGCNHTSNIDWRLEEADLGRIGFSSPSETSAKPLLREIPHKIGNERWIIGVTVDQVSAANRQVNIAGHGAELVIDDDELSLSQLPCSKLVN